MCSTVILTFVVIKKTKQKPKQQQKNTKRRKKGPCKHVNPACQEETHIIEDYKEMSIVKIKIPLQGVTEGDGKLGVDAVEELSFSSLRLKLFL